MFILRPFLYLIKNKKNDGILKVGKSWTYFSNVGINSMANFFQNWSEILDKIFRFGNKNFFEFEKIEMKNPGFRNCDLKNPKYCRKFEKSVLKCYYSEFI